MGEDTRSGDSNTGPAAGPADPPPAAPAAPPDGPPGERSAPRRLIWRLLRRVFGRRARAAPRGSPAAAASPTRDGTAPDDGDPVALAYAVLATHLPSRFEQRSKAAHHLVTTLRDGILTVLALVAAGFAAYIGYNEWSDDRPLIGKIEAPRELEEAGYSPAVLARMLSDELKEILQTSLVPVAARAPGPGPSEAERPSPGGEQRAQRSRGLASQSYRSDPIKGAAYKESDARVPEFEVVGVGFSLSDIIRTLKGQFGGLPLEIGGEIVRIGEDYGYILRLDGERVEFVRGDLLRPSLPFGEGDAAAAVAPAPAEDALGARLKRIMNGAALAVLKHTEPIAWAIHGYAIGRRNGVLAVLERYLVCPDGLGAASEETRAVRLPLRVDSLDVPRAWLLKGYVERDNGDAVQAARAFACARDTALAFEADGDESALRRSVVLANAYESLSAYDDAERVYAAVAGRRPHNAAILMGWGSLLAAIGEFVGAEEKYQQAALAEPGQTDALVALARVQDRLGRPLEASLTFERASEIAPLDAADHVDWGNTLMGVGHLEQAAASFAEAIRLEPENADAYLNRGYALWGLGEYARANQALDRAIQTFEQAVRREPNNNEKRTGYALALFARGRTIEADQEFARLVATDPANPAIHYYWGNTYAQRGDAARAAEQFRTVVELDPLPWNMITLGDTYWNLGDLPAAREQYEAALARFRVEAEKRPDDPSLFNGMGNALLRLERPDEAAAPLAEAATLDPDNPRPLIDYASALSVLGRRDEAAGYFQRAVRLDPLNPWPLWSWGRELMVQGAYVRAADVFERLVTTIDPSNGWNYVDWGDALLGGGARFQDEAREAYLTAAARFEAVLPHSPDPGPLYAALALARQKAGDHAGAAAAYESLAAYDRASPWDYAAWGDALSAAGRADAAAQRYATAVSNFLALIEAQPDNPNPRRGLAALLMSRGRFDEAIAQYRELTLIAGDDPWDHLALADALLAAGPGRAAEAERAYERAFAAIEAARRERPAGSADLLAAWARALDRLGRRAEASAKWSELAALLPDDPWSLAAAADALWADRQADRARALYEEALTRFVAKAAREPEDLALKQGQARLLATLGRNEEAIGLYVEVASLASDDYWAQLDAGRALASAGRFDAALVHFERASGIEPAHAEGWYYSGLVLMDLGRCDAAIAKFEKAAPIGPGIADAYAKWAQCLDELGRSREAAEIRRRWLLLERPTPAG